METTTKTTFNTNEAAEYLGVSRSWLLKLTSSRRIAYCKPGGKLLVFQLADLNAYLERNRVATAEELAAEAKRIERGAQR